MSKNISVSDLQLIPELSHLRMLDFIDPQYDSLISPFLSILGFDLDYPIQYVPCQHRNMQGKVVISFMIVGEVECNAKFLGSKWATIEDKVIAAGYRDIGMAASMSLSMTSCRDSTNDGGGASDGFPPDLANPDEGKILSEIRVLEDLLLIARGNPFKLDGSRKTIAEYGIIETPEKRRKKVDK